MHVRWLSLALVGVGLLLGACGSDKGGSSASTSSSSSSGGSGGATVNVTETEFKLNPASPSVDKAGKVTIRVKNAGQVTHALEVEGPGGEGKTQPIQPGKSATLEADLSKAGSYKWYCPIDGHRQQGMNGVIRVAGGGSGGATTTDSSGGGGGNGGY